MISELIIRHDLPENANHGQDRLLRRFMKLREGSHYSTELADQDLVALFESGLIDDARILAEPRDKSIRLIVEVRERQRCGPCQRGFIGNTAFSDQKLAKVISSRLKGLFTESKLEEARQELERYYRRWGYKQVHITIDYEHWGKRSVQDFVIVFVIKEGPRTQPWYEGLFRPSEKATAP
jgi:outer membrane protein assembly factor BamA